jgi:hypothetical protein
VTQYSEAEAIQTELVEGLCGNDHAVVALICLSYCFRLITDDAAKARVMD